MPETLPFTIHFLRPLWLFALIPVVSIVIFILRRNRPEAQWGDVIAPNLLKHLLVEPESRWRLNPLYLVAAGLVLGIIALSGPTWRHELPPFVEDKAPLMIALSLGPSMTERDVAPSRLERAKQKIRDLLAARAGARTGLIAYSGTAHLVMPLTDDRAVIEPFLAALTPDLMPSQGNNTEAAVALAAKMMAAESIAGTILIVADSIVGDQAALRRAAGRSALALLSVAPPQSSSPGMSNAVRASVDDTDIRSLERRIETNYQSAQSAAFGTRWRDEGYWLVLPVALLGLLWFRRGVTVAWMVAAFLAIQPPPPADAADLSWARNLWLTPDQQGRLAFDRGDYASAKELFADPMWRGIAAYRAYDFLAAAESFRKIEGLAGRFALGNAEAQNHAFEKALKAYDEVLSLQPDNTAAKHNKAIVEAALAAQEEKRRKQEKGEAPPDEKADETRVDPKQKGGKRIQVQADDLTTPGAAEAWMREVQTSPADFLKLKFSIQAAAAPRPAEAPQ
ncbi:MAG TPA: VWA domain-containing protein [Pseudolabrys sp.]|nr:VWA domain-containing protein [Pseudolabrys sp.]